MWISSRLHIFDKQSIEINLFKRLFINNYNNNKKNSFSTTIVAAVRGVRNEEERERNEETNTLGTINKTAASSIFQLLKFNF